MSERVVGVIPVRYASQRFPGKPLAEIDGKTLVQWVFEGARRASSLDELFVATDDERIREAVEGFGAPCVLTGDAPRNGTERVAEAMQGVQADLVVNVQGDEVMITGEAVDRSVHALGGDREAALATLAAPLPEERRDDPNTVKVAIDEQSRALGFSRSPASLPGEAAGLLAHVGVYVYRRSLLDAYTGLEPTTNERTEQLEQLRVLEHGHAVAVATIETEWLSVDTPADLDAVARLLAGTGRAGRLR